MLPIVTNIVSPEPLVFVDLETTGGTFGVNRITEIGVVEVGPAGVTQWSSLVNPQQPIPFFIQQLTGISDSMVRDAPTFEAIAHDLLARLDGRLFIAHNARFDHGFLRSEFKRAGIKFQPDVLCTVQLSRAIYPAERRHGLDALIERHALVPAARHRALADADLLWQFWQHLHRAYSADVLHGHIEQVARRFRLAGDIDEDTIEQIPAGCGIYVFYRRGRCAAVCRAKRALAPARACASVGCETFGEGSAAGGTSVRRVEWTATGGEIGAMLAEGRSVARLRPAHNRLSKTRRDDPSHAPWTYPGAIAIAETDATTGARVWHVVDAWQYFGMAASLDEAAQLRAAGPAACFELSTYRILSERLSHGLKIVPICSYRVSVRRAGLGRPRLADRTHTARRAHMRQRARERRVLGRIVAREMFPSGDAVGQSQRAIVCVAKRLHAGQRGEQRVGHAIEFRPGIAGEVRWRPFGRTQLPPVIEESVLHVLARLDLITKEKLRERRIDTGGFCSAIDTGQQRGFTGLIGDGLVVRPFPARDRFGKRQPL